MKKMAEGGEAGDDSAETGEDGPEEATVPQGLMALSEEEQAQSPEPPPVDLGAPPQTGQPAAAQAAAPQAQSSQMPAGYPTSEELKSLTQQGVAGIQQESTATQKQNDLMAAQYQKNLEAQQEEMKATQVKLQQYQNQYDEIQKQVAAGKIDPNKYMHDKSTGQKIAAAIGIMLGGIGAGLTHGPNVGLGIIQKNIENDIEAQKANLGNKRSLLSDNLRAQGNMMAATNATRLQMNAIAQGKLLQVAAQTGNPIIQARAQQHAAALMQGTMQARMGLANNEIQMKIRQDVLHRLSGQGQPGAQPVDMQDLARAGFVDKQTAEKEGSAISKRQQAEAFVTDQITKLRQEQKLWGSENGHTNIIPNYLNPESGNREAMLRANVLQAIQSAAPSKRLNPELVAMEAEPFLKSVWTDQTKEAGLNGLIEMIRKNADPTPMAAHYKIPGAIGGNNVIRKKFDLGPVK